METNFNYEKNFIKKNIKYKPIDYRKAEIFCNECGKTLGKIDVYYEGISKRICGECAAKYIKEVPRGIDNLSNVKIIEDYGNNIIIDYGMQQVWKCCHYTNKGRYIIINSKRYYV